MPVEAINSIEFWIDEDGEPVALLALGDVPAHLFTLEAAVQAAVKPPAEWMRSEAYDFFSDHDFTADAGPIWLRFVETEESWYTCHPDHPEATRFTGVWY